MRLPSKVTPYKRSVLPLFELILKLLKAGPLSPSALLSKLGSKISNVGDFIEALDCLYALNAIELDPKDGLLHYVN